MSGVAWLAVSVVGLYLSVHWAYVLVMSAKAAIEKGTLTLYWKVMLAPAAAIGLVLDLVFNYTFGFMFGAWPKPYLFSSTVQYWYRNGDGWRLRLAKFWARNLNVFDDHIR